MNQRRTIRARRRLAAAALLVPALALTACSSEGGRTEAQGGGEGGGEVASTERMKVAMVTHAPPGDTFWDTIRAGAEEAAADAGVGRLQHAQPRSPLARVVVEAHDHPNVVVLGAHGALRAALARVAALEEDDVAVPHHVHQIFRQDLRKSRNIIDGFFRVNF